SVGLGTLRRASPTPVGCPCDSCCAARLFGDAAASVIYPWLREGLPFLRTDDVFDGVGVAGGRAVPAAAAERSDIDLRAVVRIEDHAVPPFEVEALEAFPSVTPIY